MRYVNIRLSRKKSRNTKHVLVFPCANVSIDTNLLIQEGILVYQLPLGRFSCEAKICEPSFSKSYLCLLSNRCIVSCIFFLPHQIACHQRKLIENRDCGKSMQIQGRSAILTITSVDSAKWTSPPKSQCWNIAVQTTCLLMLFLLHICNCLVPSGRSM